MAPALAKRRLRGVSRHRRHGQGQHPGVTSRQTTINNAWQEEKEAKVQEGNDRRIGTCWLQAVGLDWRLR